MEDAMVGYRRRIPAFGEWNYNHGPDGGDYDWSVLSQRFQSATTQIPFPVHKASRKRERAGRRRRVPAFGEWNNDRNHAVDDGGWSAAVSHCFEPAVKAQKSLKQVRQAWLADSGAHMAMETFSFRVVEAVDDDLYEVPTEMLCSKSVRRKGRTWLRSLLTRCFGLNCFA